MANEADFYVDVNLHKNQIKEVIIEAVDSDPAGTAGRVIYNTAEMALKLYNGTTWVSLAQGGSLANFQAIDEKNQPNGYAGLDGTGKIVIGQIPTGVGTNSVPLIAQTISDGYVLQYSASDGGFIGRSLAGTYVFKGSKTSYSELPTEGNEVGDVWNVVNAYQTYPAGTNFAWDGSQWDALGGSIDTSVFQLITNLVNDLSSPNTSTYPSTQAVSNALATKQDKISLTPNTAVVAGASGALESSAVTSTELGYLSGVDSNIQSQIDSKQATITGAASTIASTKLTANKVVISDGDGNIAESSVSSTELGYLSGVTSAIQTQIDDANSAIDAVEESITEMGSTKADAVATGTGQWTKVTVNGQGIVTAGSNLTAGDIPNLDASKITTGLLPVARLASGSADEGKVPVVGSDGNFTLADKVSVIDQSFTGNNSKNTWTFEHNFGNRPAVTLYKSDGHVVYADIVATSSNVTINFNSAPASTDSFFLVMVG